MAARASEFAATTESADWEQSKENFQPLKAGRKPGALKDATVDLRKQEIEENRRAFWEELASYKGDDPLEVWLRFIKWTQETFAAGGHKGELLPLLERCTCELQGEERYRNDVRYLRVWVQYADCLPDPGEVFAFLKEKDIGQEHALAHIAAATYHEFCGAYARADAAYQQGINRLAAPVDRLRAKYAEFQARMARRIARKAAEQGGEATEPEHPERRTLGTLGGRRVGGTRPLGGGLLGGSGKRKADADNSAPADGLDIFVDEEFVGGGPAASAPPNFFNPARTAAGSAWGKLAGFEAGRKENMARPSVWAGQRLKQASAHSAPAAAPLQVFVDEEFSDEALGGVAPSGRGSPDKGLTLRQRLDREDGGGSAPLEEGLLADPLRLHKAQLAARPPLPGGRGMAPLAGGLAVPEAKRRREEALGFDEAALRGPDGEELSFEEVRAERWRTMEEGAPATAATASSNSEPVARVAKRLEDDRVQHDAAIESDVAAKQLTAGLQARPVLATVIEQQQQPALAAPAAPELRPTPFDREVTPPVEAAEVAAAVGGEPTVTINTAQAFAAINGMFGGTLGGGATCAPAGMEPTVTISTAEAFAAVNQMFKGGLPAEAGGCLPLHPGAEPTMSLGNVTLSTRDAFTAINRMFKGALATEHGGVLPPTTSTEPTITLSTRDAFAAINGMFGGALQLGGGQDQGVPAVGAAAGFRVPEPRPPRATSESGSRHPAMWQPDCENCGADRGGLFIREDTQFVFAASATEGAESASAAESPPAGAGFCIREDTQFIALTAAEAAPSPASSADGAGFSLPVRADTLFMAAPGPSPASSSGGSMAIRGHPSLGLRSAPATADTTSKMLGDAATDNDVLAVGSLAGSGVAGASKWGFAPGADDMLDLDLTLGADTAALLAADVGSAVAAAGATAALDVHPQAMQLSEGKENIVAVGRTIGVLHSWDVRQPQAASAALRPLCQARAAATGVAVSRDEEAEAALAAGLGACSLGTSDSFDVLASESSGSEAMEPPEHEAPAAATDPLTLDPFHSDFRARCLDSLDPPVTSWPGVVLLSEAEEAAAEAGFRAAGRPGSDLAELWLGGAVYAVSGCCGEGAYARVYQGVDGECADVALKVESPPCLWEWYVCRALQGRLPADLRAGFIDPCALLLGARMSVLVAPFGCHGSLQEALNLYLAAGAPPPEVVALHFAGELLGALGALAGARVLHADLKPDNLLLRLEPLGGDENAAPALGLTLIDFGRSVDMELLPPGARLRGDSDTDAFRCVEMRERQPWLWQADAYGTAATLHCLLFGQYMEVERVVPADGGKPYLRLKHAFQRQWACKLWGRLFGVLLNGAGGAAPPDYAALRDEVEAHLTGREEARERRRELVRLVQMVDAAAAARS